MSVRREAHLAVSLPSGLAELWDALASSGRRLDLAITLVFLRQLLDPTAPMVAGHDPRQLVTEPITWEQITRIAELGELLDAAAARVNEIVGEERLTTGLAELDLHAVKRAVDGVSKWTVDEHFTGGDMLGELLQRVRSQGNGAFYTPYNVCYAMALISGVQPGEKISDPACGSGRMLLAALQACRVHGGGEPELAGIDIDSDAVRACRLNLMLAGYGLNRSSRELSGFVAPAAS